MCAHTQRILFSHYDHEKLYLFRQFFTLNADNGNALFCVKPRLRASESLRIRYFLLEIPSVFYSFMSPFPQLSIFYAAILIPQGIANLPYFKFVCCGVCTLTVQLRSACIVIALSMQSFESYFCCRIRFVLLLNLKVIDSLLLSTMTKKPRTLTQGSCKFYQKLLIGWLGIYHMH